MDYLEMCTFRDVKEPVRGKTYERGKKNKPKKRSNEHCRDKKKDKNNTQQTAPKDKHAIAPSSTIEASDVPCLGLSVFGG